MANIGYIQVVRHCNHFCGFCSNPTTPYVHTFETMKVLVDDLKKRDYFGVILTGGEPSLHPELPRIARYASDQGLHVRMITNGWRLADEDFAREMAEAGLKLVHVSVYSVRPEVEAKLRGVPNTLERAFAAVANAHKYGIEVNINCVINQLNADHLDEGSVTGWSTTRTCGTSCGTTSIRRWAAPRSTRTSTRLGSPTSRSRSTAPCACSTARGAPSAWRRCRSAT